jgi:hypothetical protein
MSQEMPGSQLAALVEWQQQIRFEPEDSHEGSTAASKVPRNIRHFSCSGLGRSSGSAVFSAWHND